MLVISTLTAAFTALGSLESAVEFASLAFIVVFGSMSALALTVRDADDVVVIAAAVFTVEALHFKRQQLSEGVRQVEKRV